MSSKPRVRSFQLTTERESVVPQEDNAVVVEWTATAYIKSAPYSTVAWRGIRVTKVTIYHTDGSIEILPDPGFVEGYPQYPMIGWNGSDKYEQLLAYAEGLLPTPTGVTEPLLVEVGTKYNFCEDVVVQDFALRSAKGEIFNNPFKKIDVNYRIDPRGVFKHTNVPNEVTSTSVKLSNLRLQSPALTVPGLLSLLPVNFLETGNSDEQALASLHGKLAASDDSWGVSFGERQQTIDHLFLTARRLLAIYKAVRKGNFKKLAPKTWRKFKKIKLVGGSIKATDFILEAWLEARYAWRPLLIDVDNLAKRAAYGLNTNDRKTVRSGMLYSDTNQLSHSWTEGDWDMSMRVTGSTFVKSRTGALLKLNLTTDKQLGFLDIPLIMWELTPFSFILDFVADIGGLLYALTPTPSQDELAKWLSTETTTLFKGTVTAKHREHGFQESRHFSHETVTKVRNPITASSPLIVWNNNLDYLKLFDLVGIARGLQKGKLGQLAYVKT